MNGLAFVADDAASLARFDGAQLAVRKDDPAREPQARSYTETGRGKRGCDKVLDASAAFVQNGPLVEGWSGASQSKNRLASEFAVA
ncbi:MAG: hypothetical protein KJZ83_02470 [Burkholderiaceae bacterium]|nr:hypothetical protein [Burkholderiaceae bacterium]